MEQKGSTNIKVAIRIRPFIATEKENKLRPQWGTQNNNIFQIDELGQKFGEVYSFDHIFGMQKSNSDIYSDIVKDFVTTSLDGLNSTIFAYGQTSSGKTYTMLGDKNNTGIMSLAIENLFNNIENSTNRKFLIRVSYLEIYNEKINDLLDPVDKEIKIRVLYPTTPTIGLQNVKEELVSTREQMYDCLKVGNQNRHIGSTKANERSSRSHTIFKIVIESTQNCDFNNSSGSVQISNLNLVDLAGSERVAQTKATGMRLKEGGHINKSLSALGLVIKQLSDGQEYVNFRDSKLTRLLQDSLGGNSKTLVIATITLASIEDTGSTLAFAQRAKTVKNKPTVNKIVTDAVGSKRYVALNAQLQKKLDDQLIINQSLKKTQEDNLREMSKLQQQMELLEDFQFGSRSTPRFENIPKRRHTIGFSSQKLQFPRGLLDLEKSEMSEDITMFEDLTLKENPSTLETIVEEESSPKSTKKSSTPECFLRMRISSLEQDYNELVTFTRDEGNIFTEIEKKAEELKTQVEVMRRELSENQNKFTLREEELLCQIQDLEKQLQEKTDKNVGIDTSEVEDIVAQLICLHDLINNSDFLNNTEFLNGLEDIKQNSILEIIEKFNGKVKVSKNIIENEILKQINHLDSGSSSFISNELTSFNDLLNELSSFESIPVDLINNMKKESVEDFKMLIKVYESLLRKNELIRICTEKIKFLEENGKFNSETLEKEIKNLRIQELELRSQMAEKSMSVFEIQHKFDVLKEEYADKIKENENILQEIANFKQQMKANTDEFNLAIAEKDKLISNIRSDSEILTQQNKKLNVESSDLCSENKNLTYELKELKDIVNKLNMEMLKKDELIKEFQDNNRFENEEIIKNNNEKEHLLKEVERLNNIVTKHNEECDIEDLKQQLINIKTEMKKDLYDMKNNDETNSEKITNLQNEVSSLIAELNLKTLALTELENNYTSLTQELQQLRQESSEIALENDSLKREMSLKTKTEMHNLKNHVEKLSSEIADKEKCIEKLELHNEMLVKDMEKIKYDDKSNRGKIKDLDDEIGRLTSVIDKKEACLSFLKQEVEKLRITSADVLNVNESLKLEIKNLKTNTEVTNTVNKLTGEIKEKENQIEVLTNNMEKLKSDKLLVLKKKNALEKEINNLQEKIKRKNAFFSELQNNSSVLKQEIGNLKVNSSCLTYENESLKSEVIDLKNSIVSLTSQIFEKDNTIHETEDKVKNLNNEISKLEHVIEKQKQIVNENGLKVNENELKLQRHKQLFNNSQAKINDLKQSLADKEKLKCELSQYKSQTLHYTQLNEELRSQIKQVQTTQVNDCDDNANLCAKCKENDIIIKGLRESKKKLEDFLCSIIKECIIDQRTLLLNSHSQEQRDHFKVIRELRSNTNYLENLLDSIHQKKRDFNEMSDHLLKSRFILKDYYNSEKNLMEKQIEQLNSVNKKYLQEMMALKDGCSVCSSLKNEVTSLRKEKSERIKQIGELRTELYAEQDRKAKVQYTDYMKFLKEENETQLHEIRQLQKEMERYRSSTINKSDKDKQKDLIHPKGENNMNENNVPVISTAVAVQCDLLNVQKYELTKKLCRLRRQEISELTTQLANLHNSK